MLRNDKESDQGKIAFLVPFFGKMPLYFDWWAKSCEYNSDNCHWYVYSDQVIEKTYYNKSVTIIPLKFEKMMELFKEKLNINIINSVRRVCDYRIMFPLIRMEDECLYNYDFFGYTDIDVIYGDIIKFLPCNFENLSLVSGNYDRPCGPFTLINKKSIYKLINSDIVKRNIESVDHNAFDESFELKNIITECGDCFCDPDPLQPAITNKFNFRKTFCVWVNGSMTVYDNRWNKREGAFYHFSRYKNKKRFIVDGKKFINDSFCVYKYGIKPYKSFFTKIALRLSLLY